MVKYSNLQLAYIFHCSLAHTPGSSIPHSFVLSRQRILTCLPSTTSRYQTLIVTKQSIITMAQKLNYDILHQIFSLVDWHDLKSLRSTCAAFETVANRLLFCRLPISRLKRDRDAFFHISAVPRLASQVRELVWYELDLFKERSPRCTYHADIWNRRAQEPTGMDGLELSRIISMARRSDKLELKSTPTTESPNPDMVSVVVAFQGEFLAALDRLPGLMSISSLPMPANQVVFTSESGDQLRAGCIRDRQISKRARRLHHGFPRFLVPAMVHLGRKIEKVTLVGESQDLICTSGMRCTPFRDIFPRLPPPAFSNLTSLDIHLRYGLKLEDSNLAAFIQSARGLEKLSLSFDGPFRPYPSPCRYSPCYRFPRIFLEDSTDTEAAVIWTRLHSFSLKGLLIKQGELDEFVARHAATLRHLSLTDCPGVTTASITNIAKIDSLRLYSLQVEGARHGLVAVVSEEPLLAFVNKETGYNPLTATSLQIARGNATGFTTSVRRREDTRYLLAVPGCEQVEPRKDGIISDGGLRDGLEDEYESVPSGDIESGLSNGSGSTSSSDSRWWWWLN